MLEKFLPAFLISLLFASTIYSEEELQSSGVFRILNLIGTFSVALSVYTTFLSTSAFSMRSLHMAFTQTMKLNDKYWIDFNEKLKDVAEKHPEFVASLMWSLQKNDVEASVKDVNLSFNLDEGYMEKRELALYIFQAWEDSIYKYKNIQNEQNLLAYDKWIKVFIQFASSKELKFYWDREKHSYRDDTIVFGDRLFDFIDRLRKDKNYKGLDKIEKYADKFVKEDLGVFWKTVNKTKTFKEKISNVFSTAKDKIKEICTKQK